jgi:hypothetical protein
MIQHGHTNILETGSVSILTGGEETLFPLRRLWDRNPGKLYKGVGAVTHTYKIDQGPDNIKQVDRLLIPKGHNLWEFSEAEFFPTLIQVPVGTYITGDLDSVKVVDLDYYQIQEVIGVPGFNLFFTWQNLPQQLDTFKIVGRYEGNPAHVVKAQIFNQVTLLWEDFLAGGTDFPSGAPDAFYDFTFPGTVSDYYTGSAGNWTCQIRIRHNTTGTPTHNFYADFVALAGEFDIEVLYSDDDITYLPAGICDTVPNDSISCPLIEGTHRYWKVIFHNVSAAPEAGEMFLTDTYTWLREAEIPYGPLEDVTNSVQELTASGSHRAVILGDNRRQRVFNIRVKETDKTNILDLFNTVGFHTPFFIDDNGTWIYVRFRNQPPQFTQISEQVYTATIELEEVIDS